MPHTVRRRVCAIRPTTMALNVVNVGVVKQDRKTANRSANEPCTVVSGSIEGPLSRGWCKHRRCFPHSPRTHTLNRRRVANDHQQDQENLRNTRTHIGDNNPAITLDADPQPQRGFVDSLLDRRPPGWRSVWRDREATALALRRA